MKALGHLRDDADLIVPQLMALMKRSSVRWSRRENCQLALEAIGSLGPSAKSAPPVLRTLAEDDDIGIAKAAATALEKVAAR